MDSRRKTAEDIIATALDRDDISLVDRLVLALSAAMLADPDDLGRRENARFHRVTAAALRRLERRGFLADPDHDGQYVVKHPLKWPRPI